MTVTTTPNKVSFSANGSTTVFAYNFKIFADADLTVIIRASDGTETTKTLTTHYTVSGAGSSSGGNVTFTSGNTPANGETVVIKRELDVTQSTDYVANDPFPAASHEDALDRLTMIAQQQTEEIGRSIVFPDTDTAATTIPNSVTRANKFLGFGSSGEVAVLSSTGTAPGAIDTGNLVDSAVTSPKLASNSITSAKIADDAVTQAKIADDAVGADQLASNAVVDASVASGAAIAFSKMADLTASRALVSDANGDVSASAVTSTELGYLDGVTSAIQTQIDGIAGYPQVITLLTSGTSYTIPSDAQAILIKASGGGGSGGSSQFSGNHTTNGQQGGQTTVSNGTLGLSMVVMGGASGRGSTGGTASVITGDSGLHGVLRGGGAAGGAPGMNNFDISCSFGGNANLGFVYLTGTNLGGEVLTYSLGAGAAGATAGSTTSAPGQGGYLEITVW